MMLIDLQQRLANGGRINSTADGGYLLSLPPVFAGKYGLAQVDDYMDLPRRKFPHLSPLRFQIEACVSNADLPGTWGFGFWNDPFSFGFGGGGMVRILPTVPNAAWFFYGSHENHLSLRDDQLGSGFQAKTFQAPRLPSILSLLVIPGIPFMIWPATDRLLRKLARTLVKEDAADLTVAVDAWHAYSLTWMANRVIFSVDNNIVLSTEVSPQGQLGLVIWIDNQYFRFGPDGRVGFGFLEAVRGGWLQVRNLAIDRL
jgi:hypothetical protein